MTATTDASRTATHQRERRITALSLLAGVMVAIAVPVTVFVLAQRYFVENVAATGIK